MGALSGELHGGANYEVMKMLLEIEDESKESGIVLEEIQKGFMMKDRLLRPSLVGVSKKTVKKDGNLSENNKKDEKK